MNHPDGDFSELDMAVMEQFVKDKDGVYLEVGVKYGKSLAFVRDLFKGDVYGVDIADTIDWSHFKDREVTFINKASNEAVKDWDREIDVLFIDGDHSYEGVKDDWDNFSPFVKKGGVILFHDCDETSPGVVKLANEVGGKKLKTYKEKYGQTSMASLVK